LVVISTEQVSDAPVQLFDSVPMPMALYPHSAACTETGTIIRVASAAMNVAVVRIFVCILADNGHRLRLPLALAKIFPLPLSLHTRLPSLVA
jgi:hypothetical protein